MSADTPPERVLVRARELELGAFESRVRRRPGVPGAVVCVALLILGCNFIQNGPHNLGITIGLVAGGLVVVGWAWVWFRRVRGGLYLFEGGFVDAAGIRLTSAKWADVKGVKAEGTDYYVGPVPSGRIRHFKLDLSIPPYPHIPSEWELNTTYEDVAGLAALIARRAGVEVEYVKAP